MISLTRAIVWATDSLLAGRPARPPNTIYW